MSPDECIRPLLLRELRALRREVEAYPDDESLWVVPGGISNSAGNLVLHLAGNLRYFVGNVLGGDDYDRDRQAEFGCKGLSRNELLAEIDATEQAVDSTLSKLPAERLRETYPVSVVGESLSTHAFLTHLVAHLAYHLGQVDYHRRITNEGSGHIHAVSLGQLKTEP